MILLSFICLISCISWKKISHVSKVAGDLAERQTHCMHITALVRFFYHVFFFLFKKFIYFFPVLHHLLELAQTHVHWVGDTIQPSHPLSFPSPPAFNLAPASGSFPISQFFASGGQSIGASASASVLLMNIQDWLPLGLTSLISLQSKGLSRVFSNTTVQKHQPVYTLIYMRSKIFKMNILNNFSLLYVT